MHFQSATEGGSIQKIDRKIYIMPGDNMNTGLMNTALSLRKLCARIKLDGKNWLLLSRNDSYELLENWIMILMTKTISGFE